MMNDHFDHIPEGVKFTLDALSFTALLGTITAMLPSAAALVTLLWYGLRIYESKTVQGWLKR